MDSVVFSDFPLSIDNHFDAFVANTQLGGGNADVITGGTATCVGAYDDSFSELPIDCVP
jgi:hypothetical protein